MQEKKEYDVVDTVSNQVYFNEEERKEKWKDQFEERNDKIKQVINKGEILFCLLHFRASKVRC